MLRVTRAAGASLGVVFFVCVVFTACESVPDLHFVDPDGSASSGADGGGVADGEADGAPTSADAGGSEAEAGSGSACTAPPPAGSPLCCGTIWCVGCSTASQCNECAGLTNCAVADLCCQKQSGGMGCFKNKCP